MISIGCKKNALAKFQFDPMVKLKIILFPPTSSFNLFGFFLGLDLLI